MSHNHFQTRTLLATTCLASCLVAGFATAADLELGQGATFDGANRTYLRTARGIAQREGVD